MPPFYFLRRKTPKLTECTFWPRFLAARLGLLIGPRSNKQSMYNFMQEKFSPLRGRGARRAADIGPESIPVSLARA